MGFKKFISMPDILFLIAVVSMILPGMEKSFLIITTLSIMYILKNFRYVRNTQILIFVIIMSIFSVFQYQELGGFLQMSKFLNIKLAMVYGLSLQRIRSVKEPEMNGNSQKQVFLLGIAYLILLYRGYGIAMDGYWSAGNIIWTFHSSILSVVGNILAIEIYTKYTNRRSLFIAFVLFSLPVLGGSRQQIFMLIPILVYFILNRRSRKQLIAISLFVVIVIFSFGLKMNFDENLLTAMQRKSGGISGMVNIEENLSDDEDTFQERFGWWQETVESTVDKNIFFGYLFMYRFTSQNYPSGMLHSQFATAFADGGLILFISTLSIYWKFIYEAIKKRNWISLIITYLIVIVMAVNAWGAGTGAFVIFYILGYYTNPLYMSITKQKRI